MTNEEKAKVYDKAVEIAKSKIKNNKDHVLYEDDIIEIFPELKESEDEKIRKWIVDELKDSLHTIEALYSGDYDNRDNDDIIREGYLRKALAWLEKQGEQNTNEIHPIFRVGDYIKNKKTSDKVLIEQLDIATKAYCYVSYDGGAEIHSDFSFSKQDEWMLIGQNIVEQKPAWSEEDEDYCLDVNTAVGDYFDEGYAEELRDWLKSLKERYSWKPSEEQIEVLENVRKLLHANEDIYNKANNLMSSFEELIRALKKLKE